MTAVRPVIVVMPVVRMAVIGDGPVGVANPAIGKMGVVVMMAIKSQRVRGPRAEQVQRDRHGGFVNAAAH